jgi:hypothetical protein
MAVKLLLRDDWISTRQSEIEARWRSEFPECAVAFDQIKRHAAEGRDKAARKALFHLFRPIARDIVDQIGSVEIQARKWGKSSDQCVLAVGSSKPACPTDR